LAEQVKYYATGRRKEAVARVSLVPGKGEIKVNNKKFDDYFKREAIKMMIVEPLQVTGTENAYDVVAVIQGGGLSGQAGALRHGISRALLNINDEYRLTLKKAGFLTRDPRIKERKKYGLKKARKKPQFSKR